MVALRSTIIKPLVKEGYTIKQTKEFSVNVSFYCCPGVYQLYCDQSVKKVSLLYHYLTLGQIVIHISLHLCYDYEGVLGIFSVH